MNDKDFDAVTSVLMTDQDYQNVNVRGVDLWLLLCACQTVVASDHIHEPLKAIYRDLGKRLQAIVIHLHPEAKELAARGWDTFVDGPNNPYSFWRRFSDDDGGDYPDEEGDT